MKVQNYYNPSHHSSYGSILQELLLPTKSQKLYQNLPLLERLHAENTSLTDVATQNLSKLSNLKYLNLYGTDISDASIENFRKLRKLRKDFLWQTKVTQKVQNRSEKISSIKVFMQISLKKKLFLQKSKKSSSFDSEMKLEKLKIKSLSQKTQTTHLQ